LRGKKPHPNLPATDPILYRDSLLARPAGTSLVSKRSLQNVTGILGKIPKISQQIFTKCHRHCKRLPVATMIPKKVWQNLLAGKVCQQVATKRDKKLSNLQKNGGMQWHGAWQEHTNLGWTPGTRPGWPGLSALVVPPLLLWKLKGGGAPPGLQAPLASRSRGPGTLPLGWRVHILPRRAWFINLIA
jgi:hypothetical protein